MKLILLIHKKTYCKPFFGVNGAINIGLSISSTWSCHVYWLGLNFMNLDPFTQKQCCRYSDNLRVT